MYNFQIVISVELSIISRQHVLCLTASNVFQIVMLTQKKLALKKRETFDRAATNNFCLIFTLRNFWARRGKILRSIDTKRKVEK